MTKSADAFRTISEVADWLNTPAHVLRFWESKFTQVKPVKRAGGRRYYRPADMKLLGGIKRLLHEDGMTIKGVQKLLREQGMAHVANLSQPLGDAADDVEVSALTLDTEAPPVVEAPAPRPAPETKQENTQETTQETAQEPGPETSAPAAQPAAPQPDLPEAPEPVSPAPTQRPDARPPEPVAADPAGLPGLRDPREAPDTAPDTPPAPQTEATDVPASKDAAPVPPAPVPPPPVSPAPIAAITVPDLPEDAPDDIAASPGTLAALARLPRPISAELADQFQRIAAALRATGGAGGRQ